jgi:hypothetical protein
MRENSQEGSRKMMLFRSYNLHHGDMMFTGWSVVAKVYWFFQYSRTPLLSELEFTKYRDPW